MNSDSRQKTIEIEDSCTPPFFKKAPVSFARGKGVKVYDEAGREYLDLTSGWGVTCLGHTHPVVVDALIEQSEKIMQNPDSGKTYSPARARLLALLRPLLPHGLTRVFFASSGAEANDAAIKLARKVTGRKNIVSALGSFHGRTIGATSATGQKAHRERYNVLVPHHRFVPFNDLAAVEEEINDDVAAVIVEPIQGEGGVNVPSDDYLPRLSALCERHGALLIIDEIQTGFFRTGPLFASARQKLTADFMTMGKGIAGGFPMAAFAVSERVARRIETGDHGGTYCGNPLGCAVAHAVIDYLVTMDIGRTVKSRGDQALAEFRRWQKLWPAEIADVRGRGLLLAVELNDAKTAAAVQGKALEQGVIVNLTQGRILRLFPALNITRTELAAGLEKLKKVMETVL